MASDKDNKVIKLDKKRVDRLALKGHYMALFEEYETLRIKFMNEKNIPSKEAIRLITLTKYMMKHGHNEPFKLSAKYFYKKYIKPFDL